MSRSITDALAWALIHFLWQGALIALLASVGSFFLRRARSTTRYALFCGAMVMMLVVPAITLISLVDRPVERVATAPRPVPQAAMAFAPGAPPAAHTAAAPAPNSGPAYLPWLVRLWLAGVVLLAIRATGGWVIAQRLKFSNTAPATEAIQRTANRLRSRLDIKRMVQVFESTVAEVPSVIGWLRPVILLPVSALTALSPEQIELLLAHELAHIRRYDYFINLLQTAVETVLFYHPAVWWISSQIRAEREHCCDDLAVQACGDPIAYARTLAEMEGLRTKPVRLALAADGGSLLSRIQRLLNREGTRRHTPPAWVGALLPVAVVLISVLSVRPTNVKAVQPEGEPEPMNMEAAADVLSHPQPKGYLAGLSAAGYTKVTVDEIISLKQNGVEPKFIKGLMDAGLGTPEVGQLIKLSQHGVAPDFVARVVQSGLVKNPTFECMIQLREHGVDPEEMGRIRALGYGPFESDEITKLRDQGVKLSAFEALKEAGIEQAGVHDAVQVQENGISAGNIRSARTQGFANLTLEQIIKLRRAGVI